MPLTRQQIYRRRRITVAVIALLVLTAGIYVPASLLAPVPPAVAELQPYTAQTGTPAAVELPGFGASAVGSAQYGGVLTAAGNDQPLPIASIAKVVTALVVLDAHPLTPGETGPTITMTERDLDFYRGQLAQNGSVRPVSAGLKFSQHDLLELTLIVSANNYAETLAAWAFGSIDEYLVAARDWLAANGMSGITVVDATGIDPANTATATALLPLAERALADPVIAQIVATTSGTMHDIGPMKNTNPVLGDEGVTGLKTGTLFEYGYNLLFSADLAVSADPAGDSLTVPVVGVVLGAPNASALASSVRAALASTRAGFAVVELTSRGDVFGQYTTPWGQRAALVAAESASAVVWSNQPVSAMVNALPLSDAVAGAEAGAVSFSAGGNTIEVPLIIDGSIAGPDPWWRLTNPAEVF